MLALFMFATPAFAAETQTVSIDPSTATKAVGDPLSIAVDYAITNDAVSKGLSIRVHYNSKKLTFVSLTNVYGTDKLGQVDVPQDDTAANLDGDVDTDKQVNVTWTNFSGTWPGAARTLFNANFTVNAGAYNGVTNINLSNAAPAPGFTVVKTGIALTVTGGKDAPSTPVLSPVTGFYKSAQSVTATVDAAPTLTYYTVDGSTPDASKTAYTGAAIPVDAADGVAVTVKMKSYDPGEPVWGAEGSAVYTFDKANPTAVFTAPVADKFVKTTAFAIAGTAADTGSGVSKVEVSINGGTTWKNATGTTNWTYAATLANGANAISVRVTDKAGNSAIVAGNTITYYPPLVLKLDDGTVVTGTTIYIPNTAGSNAKTITVSGGSGAFATYTWLPANSAFGALTAGVSADKMVYTAVLGAKGTHAITVQDPVDTTVFTAGVTVEVVSFSVTGNAAGYVGKAIVFTAQGNTGNVSWKTLSGAAVAGTPVISGNKNTIATVTPLTAGTFQLEATDAGTTVAFSVPVVTVYTVPDFSLLPTETVNVNPGAASDVFTVSGGDGTYNWTVAGPSAVPGGAAATYTFVAPTVGNFAGTYVVTAAESAAYSQTFNVYVPLKIDPTKTAISIMSNAAPYPISITGAANAIPYSVTIDSLDDAAADIIVNGTFAANTAVYAFDPTAYSVTSATGSKDYSVGFEVQGLTAPPAIDFSIIPVKTFNFAGIVTEADGTALPGAIVSITGPAGFKGLSYTTDAITGAFAFNGLTAVDSTVFGFMAQKVGFISNTFNSTALADTGLTQIALPASGSSVSGNVGVVAQVSIFDAAGKVGGPVTSDAVGDFRFDLSTVWSVPVDYTVTASATGLSGYTTVTADSAHYTGVNFVLAAVGASGYTVTAGAEPTGLSTVGAGGGTLDFSADPKLAGGVVQNAFGSNAIKLTISPVAGGNVVAVALPQPKTYTDTTIPISSGIQWEINGLGKNCATIPVPCTMADALAVANGTKAIYYENSGTPGVWNALVVDPAKIYYNGDNSLIEVELCDWSSNVLGIGNAAAAVSSLFDDSGCFIGSLSSNAANSNMTVWISIMAILAAGLLIAVGRKQRN